jgi:hypothetical protein
VILASSRSGPYTRADSPPLRNAVGQDLARLVGALEAWAPAVGVALGGSFGCGEAAARWDEGRLEAWSDYDLFVSLPARGFLARIPELRGALEALAPRLHNPEVDLNLLLPGRGLPGDRVPPPVLAGSFPSPEGARPGARLAFALHSLHAAQAGLLACAPCQGRDAAEQRQEIARCALLCLRAAWNLEAPQPVHRVGDGRAALLGPWGQGVELALRAFLLDAHQERIELGALGAPALGPEQLAGRWMRARRATELLYERWHWRLALDGPAAGRAVRWERVKGRARLGLGALVAGRRPRLERDAHLGLIEARRALLESVLPGGGLDPAWLARGLGALGRLGLGPRRWPRAEHHAFALAARASVLPNPLRLVISARGQQRA